MPCAREHGGLSVELLLVVTSPSRTPREVRIEVDPASPAAGCSPPFVTRRAVPRYRRLARRDRRPHRPGAAGRRPRSGARRRGRADGARGTRRPAPRPTAPAPRPRSSCGRGRPRCGPPRAPRGRPGVPGRPGRLGRHRAGRRRGVSRRHLHLGVGSKSVVATDAGSTQRIVHRRFATRPADPRARPGRWWRSARPSSPSNRHGAPRRPRVQAPTDGSLLAASPCRQYRRPPSSPVPAAPVRSRPTAQDPAWRRTGSRAHGRRPRLLPRSR